MAEYLIQDTSLEAIADAINAKTGGSSAMTPAEMAAAIGSISGGGGGIQSASGEINLAYANSNTNLVVSGLSFEPQAFMVFANATTTKTMGAFQFFGFTETYININNSGPSQRRLSIALNNLPNSLMDYDARPIINYITSDGFNVSPAVSNYVFDTGATYYWTAWRFTE